jgi:hypothetical protein
MRDEYPILPFGPDQQVRILGATRQVGRIADLDRIDGVDPSGVVAHDGRQEPTGEILIEQESDGH